MDSSDIRNALDDNISEHNDDISDVSDLEAPVWPSDESLLDYSSGSGEVYSPHVSELETSDQDVDEPNMPVIVPNQGRPNVPNQGRHNNENLNLERQPWVRVHPPEPPKDITSNFRVRDPGPKNMPPGIVGQLST